MLEPAVRAALVDRLAAAGLPRIEAVSLVSPARVPQMAGAEEVIAALTRKPGVVYAGLVLNERGYDRLLAAGLDEVHFAFSATESFNQRNQGAPVAESIEAALRIVGRARADGIRATVTIGVAFGCPFEGAVAPDHVLALAERIAGGAPDEIVLADTIGVGKPGRVARLVAAAREFGLPVGVHLHNTRNTGLANAYAALEAGRPSSTRPSEASAAARSRRGRRGTSPPRTSSICCTARASTRASTWADRRRRVARGRLGRQLEGQVYRAGTFAPVAA